MNSFLARRPYVWAALLLAVCGLALAWSASALPLHTVHSRARLHAAGHPTVVAVGHKTSATSATPATGVTYASATGRVPHTPRTPKAHQAGGLRPAAAPDSLPTAVPLYTFPGQPGGDRTSSRLIQAEDGNFYGVTRIGGTANRGTAFRMTPDGTVTVLDSFGAGTSDGQFPGGPLVAGVNADGTPSGAFFGTTQSGGDTDSGTIYMLAPDAGRATKYAITYLYSFVAGTDGDTPQGGLTVGHRADGSPDGYVYGTTTLGGHGSGVVFRMTTNGFQESVVYAFPAKDSNSINQGGAAPHGTLVQRYDASGQGAFFGTTLSGGSGGQGTVFSLTPAGQLVTLHDFQNDGSDGYYAVTGLTQTTDGALFGVTQNGGAIGYGTVFQVVADSGSSTGFTYSQIVFLDQDNGGPSDSLIQASDGNLYGTGSFGGTQYFGSVFRVAADSSSPSGYSATQVYTPADSRTEGSYLAAGVTQGTDGDLYGATGSGGSAGAGTIYRLNLGLPPVGGSPAPQITTMDYHVIFHAGAKATSTITVNGSGFVDTPGGSVTGVRTGTGLSITFVSTTQVVLNLDNTLPSGNHDVTVTNPDGKSAEATLTTYDGPQISPPVGFQYSGNANAALVVDGTSFVRGGTLTVSNTAGTSMAVSLNGAPNPVGTEYTALFTGQMPAGNHLITITNPDGLFTSTTFTTYGRPEIDVVDYHLNPSTNTSTVTVTGNHFVRGGQFTIGNTFTGTTIDATINNAPNPEGFQIVAQLNKPLPTGDHLVTVTNPDGQKATNTFTTYSEKGPNITRLQSIARSDGSSDLLITGTGFVHTPGVSVTNVTTGTTLGVTSDSTTSLTVHLSKVLPLGTHDVKVTNPDGQYAQATLTTYGKPRIDGAVAITQTGGEVRMVVSGVDFYPGGYNGNPSGATVIVRDPSGNVVPSRILSGPGVPANIGATQQITLSLGHARNGQNYTVEIDNSDGQTSRPGALSLHAFADGGIGPHSQSAGSAKFNVYTSNQTQYHASFFESLLAFFHLQFLLQPSGNATPTQLLPGDVSLVDQHPSLLRPTGPGSIAIGLISQDGGGLIAQGGGNVVSNDGGSIVATGGGNVVSNDGGSVISNDGGSLIAQGGGNLISQDGGGLISQDGGGLISQDGGGIVATGGGNVLPITGLVAPVGASAGLGGKLDVNTLISQDGGGLRGHARPSDSQNQVAVSFSLTKFDQGAENGTGPTEAQVYGQDANGNDILILSIRYTPDQPDVVTYKAPGLDLTTTNGTPDPLVANPIPTLTSVSPDGVTAGSGAFTIAVTGTLFEDGTTVTWNGQPLATTVLSGTQATALVPASLTTVPRTVQVSVANPAPGGGSARPMPFTVKSLPILDTFGTGLQMLSAPEDFSGIALGTAFSVVPPRMVTWDPTGLQYLDASALIPGRSFWARPYQNTDLYALGLPTPTDKPFSIGLTKGWNMIADPFPATVSLASAAVQAAGKTYTVSDASKAGLLGYLIYSYPAGSAQYQTNTLAGSLQPYQGYWVHAFAPCTLVIPAP